MIWQARRFAAMALEPNWLVEVLPSRLILGDPLSVGACVVPATAVRSLRRWHFCAGATLRSHTGVTLRGASRWGSRVLPGQFGVTNASSC